MALGLVAFAVLPLMALLANGLTSNRKSIDTTTQVQIVEWARGYARSFDADEVPPARHVAEFDEFGIVTDGPGDPSFTAEITTDTVSLPGASGELRQWKVVVRSPVRANQTLGTSVFWSRK